MTIPDSAMDEARAALAPTLDATAAILPWVAQAKKPRFPPEVAQRWQAVSDRLATIWSVRHPEGLAGLRPAVFELYAAALELGDPACLRLAEALASATDRLEASDEVKDPRLAAALSATLESLSIPGSLEQDGFPDRARHFAERLERCADPQGAAQTRSPVLDRLFKAETQECLERIHEALALLPADAYAIKVAAEDIAHLAEPLDLDHISALAGRLIRTLVPKAGKSPDLDQDDVRNSILNLVADLENATEILAQE